jgi:far upstream element-binding protein
MYDISFLYLLFSNLTNFPYLFPVGLMQSKKVYVPVREHPEINYLGFFSYISLLTLFCLFTPSSSWIGLLIGPRGRSQKELEQRTGARIYIRGRGSQKEFTQAGHPDDDDDLHVCVEGPEPNVNAAMAEIEELLFNPQQTLRVKEEQLKNLHAMNNSLQLYNPADIQKLEDGEALVELEIPNHLVGYLIGKGGENIHKMQSQTGVHVQITKESDMKPGETLRLVVLRGPEEGVVEAKRRVDELVKERLMGNKSSKQLEQMENYDFLLKVPVPNDKVGVIIGKGGNIVKGIQERTHTLIHIPSAPDEDNKATRTLSICGDTRDAVDAAQMEIFVILQQQQQQTSGGVIGGVANAMYLAVPDERVGVIIGRAGCTIKDIQARYNVKVQIPQGPDPGSQPPVRTIRYLPLSSLSSHPLSLVSSRQYPR